MSQLGWDSKSFQSKINIKLTECLNQGIPKQLNWDGTLHR